jgi:hypothetical protein
MKKKIMTLSMLLASCLFANNLSAQGAYVTINTGYGFGAASSNIKDFTNNTVTTTSNSKDGSSTTTTTNEQIKVSLGKGINFGGAVGYMFNKNVGVELGISYLIGGKTTAKVNKTEPSDDETASTNDGTTTTNDYYNSIINGLLSSTNNRGATTSSSTVTTSTTTTLSANMFKVNPSFVLTAGFEKLNPYAKFGVILGTGSIKYEYEEISSSATTKYTEKRNGGLALGLNASIGANYSLTDNISLFGELALTNLSYAPTKGEKTDISSTDADRITDLTLHKNVDYVDKTTTVENTSKDNTSTTQQELKQKYSFGSFGLNIGVRIKL